jgi:hypothetical protein
MKYRLDLLSPDEFEELVNRICQKLLGQGVESFSKGRDGGIDGRFEGTANQYPSIQSPWSGIFIIQAKHTTILNSSFSDRDVFGNKSSLVNQEIEKIQKLELKETLNNYLLFSNRKLSAGKSQPIIKSIKENTTVNNVAIFGIEMIEGYLKQYIEIAKEFDLSQYSMPFEFYDKDIRDVIKIFHEQEVVFKNKPKLKETDFFRPGIEEKNSINNLSKHYFENNIRRQSQKYFTQIDQFLKNPRNVKFAMYYANTVIELNNAIEIKRDTFESFQEVFGYVYQYIFEKNEQELRNYRRLIYVFLHFMYYNCDIGRSKE